MYLLKMKKIILRVSSLTSVHFNQIKNLSCYIRRLTLKVPGFLVTQRTGALCFQIDFTRTFRHSKYQRPNWTYQRPKRAKFAFNRTSEFGKFRKQKKLFLLRTSKRNTGNVKTGYQIQDFLKLDWILATPGYPRLPQDS